MTQLTRYVSQWPWFWGPSAWYVGDTLSRFWNLGIHIYRLVPVVNAACVRLWECWSAWSPNVFEMMAMAVDLAMAISMHFGEGPKPTFWWATSALVLLCQMLKEPGSPMADGVGGLSWSAWSWSVFAASYELELLWIVFLYVGWLKFLSWEM